MPLFQLLEVPKNENDWALFTFSLRDQTNRIRQAILQQKGINLTEYQIYPVDFNKSQEYLENVQQSQEDINSTLGLQSVDLESVDFKDQKQLISWVNLLYQQLFDQSSALHI